ncbi:MAG TPA: putative glycoside hydrolase [Steroidobacteraceae bacterium]|nr:putative glycoside hydrolase [Steroidobacteraceae bacterium]
MRRLTSLLATSAALLLAAGTASAYDKPDFPRLAGVNVGGPFNYDDATYQAQLSRLNLSILASWPNMKPGGVPMEQIVRAIKARNPNSMVFLYINSNELGDRAVVGGAWDAYRAKMDQMKWYLYQTRTDGAPLTSAWGSTYKTINNTMLTAPDSSGKHSIEWITTYMVDNLYKPNPSIDGFFMDNVFWKPRVSGDWNRDGVTDSADSAQAATWLRLGYQRHFTLAKSLMPGKYQLGNVADWGETKSVLTEYNGYVQGGVLEGMIGQNYSPEKWGTWNSMMAWYRKTMSALGEPKLGVFNQHGDLTDYRSFRYGFASCLMDDGYYSFTAAGRGYSGVDWFDEYDVKLGKAISSPPTSAWKNGVYRRDFEKGIVLVNPKGNGPQTVTLESGFKRFLGKQAPSVNNGADVTTVTLQERDGIVLVRKKASAPPAAPQLIAVH